MRVVNSKGLHGDKGEDQANIISSREGAWANRSTEDEEVGGRQSCGKRVTSTLQIACSKFGQVGCQKPYP